MEHAQIITPEATLVLVMLDTQEKMPPNATPPPPDPAPAATDERNPAHNDSENEPEDRLPLGWEKKLAAVDCKWFLAGRNEFITDIELRTYVQTMGWADSSNSGHEDLLRIIVDNLDAALAGAPKSR